MHLSRNLTKQVVKYTILSRKKNKPTNILMGMHILCELTTNGRWAKGESLIWLSRIKTS